MSSRRTDQRRPTAGHSSEQLEHSFCRWESLWRNFKKVSLAQEFERFRRRCCLQAGSSFSLSVHKTATIALATTPNLPRGLKRRELAIARKCRQFVSESPTIVTDVKRIMSRTTITCTETTCEMQFECSCILNQTELTNQTGPLDKDLQQRCLLAQHQPKPLRPETKPEDVESNKTSPV